MSFNTTPPQSRWLVRRTTPANHTQTGSITTRWLPVSPYGAMLLLNAIEDQDPRCEGVQVAEVQPGVVIDFDDEQDVGAETYNAFQKAIAHKSAAEQPLTLFIPKWPTFGIIKPDPSMHFPNISDSD